MEELHKQHAVQDTCTLYVEEAEEASVSFIFDFVHEIKKDGTKLYYLAVIKITDTPVFIHALNLSLHF